MNRDPLFLNEDEILSLADKLDRVATDHLVEEMLEATDGQARTVDLAGVSTAPTSRPPYPIGMFSLVDDLCSELSTTIRLLEEGRGYHFSGSSDSASMAAWLSRKCRDIAMLEAAPEIHEGLTRVIRRSLESVNLGERMRVTQSMLDDPTRQWRWYTAGELGKLGRKFGDTTLTKRRVEFLAAQHGLKGYRHPDTRITTYRLDAVLRAHRAAPTRSRVSDQAPTTGA
ncbi:MAG: hypothetical protein INR66_14915 [Gordonia polyisoprenivorans]|nr:hypothetical protein [Gordonia polyisoprenivorans]